MSNVKVVWAKSLTAVWEVPRPRHSAINK